MITENKASLDMVMQEIAQRYGDGIKGYSHEEICEIISKIAKVDLIEYFEGMLSKSDSVEIELKNALSWVGLKLEDRYAETKAEQMIGIKTATIEHDQNMQVLNTAPASLGEQFFSVGDVIVEINNEVPTKGIENMIADTSTKFKVKRFGDDHTFEIKIGGVFYCSTYKVVVDKEAPPKNIENRITWLNLESNAQ
jgi:predicted metalloprotease with PDZ domain